MKQQTQQAAGLDRRGFLGRTAAVAGGMVVGNAGLTRLAAHAQEATGSVAAVAGRRPVVEASDGYGPLAPVADQRGEEVLALPAGFTYVTFGRTGEPLLSDSSLVHPRNHDGMGSFDLGGGITRLIRNHENRNAPGDSTLGVPGPDGTKYDPLGAGGTVTIDFDRATGQVVRDLVSLNGTIVNCAGGIAFGASGWITCEETTSGTAAGFAQNHGYAFLVPVEATTTVPAVPLREMGRFSHEAVTVNVRNGHVYETEDAGDNSGFYRYIPRDPSNLAAGGTLQMLAVAGRPNYDTIRNQRMHRRLPVEWVTIPDPDPDLEAGASSVFDQGADRGGARFARLEGSWWGGHSVFFNATSGGNAGRGQVWEYDPGPGGGHLVLRFESPDSSVLDGPDNLNVTPRGGILLCEDDATGLDGDTHPLAPGIENVNRLVGLDHGSRHFEFAVNRLNDTEFAGACWSGDGETLFVNIFGDDTPGSGMTCAITGPWGSGLL